MLKKQSYWMKADEEDLITHYIQSYTSFIEEMPLHQQRKECISGLNRLHRFEYWSCHDLNIPVNPGDVCFFDYGQAFINEAGYQHFGLVLSQFNQKVFVIPMTSNQETIKKAMNACKSGKHHLYYIGHLKGLTKPSVLFLNDCKYINSSRIISVNAHIETDSTMFKEIIKYVQEVIFPDNMIK